MDKKAIQKELESIWRDTKLPFRERRSALEMLGKELGMFKDTKVHKFDLDDLMGRLGQKQVARIAGASDTHDVDAKEIPS